MTIDLSELRDSARKAFPADKLIPARDESWKLVCELGWLLLDLPEALGGLELGRSAAAAIHFEMGRVLSAAPLNPALLGLQAIASSSVLAGREAWIERICGGAYVPLHMLPSKVVTAASGHLSGRIAGVFEADMASHVVAALPGSYALVPVDAPGVKLVERPLWDRSRRMFDIELDGFRIEPALVLARGDDVIALHDMLSATAQLAIAADCVGGAAATLERTVDYLKMRKQFDRPLAMFQALKHRCADMQVQVAAAEALLWSRSTDPQADGVSLGALKAHAADLYRLVAEEAVQLHGGIGLTEEHDCHLFMKRAMLNLQLCGSADFWRERAGRAALAALL